MSELSVLILFAIGYGNGTGVSLHEVSKLYRTEVCTKIEEKINSLDNRIQAFCVPLDEVQYWRG